MKTDIILAGVGGQGILSIAASIGLAAVEEDVFIKQAEVHGMSQRGGAVQSNLRLSSDEIASDLISEQNADLILSVEPMEALRYLPYLSDEGWIVTNKTLFVNIPTYPEADTIYAEIAKHKNHILIDADTIAKEVGTAKASNIVMLGAGSPFIQVSVESLETGIRNLFARKGDKIVETNIKAFRAGREFALKAANL